MWELRLLGLRVVGVVGMAVVMAVVMRESGNGIEI